MPSTPALSLNFSGMKEFAAEWSDLPKGEIKQAFKKSLAKTATVLNKAVKRNAKRLRHRSIGGGFLRIPGSDAYARVLTRNGKTIRTIYRPLGTTFFVKSGISRRTGNPYAYVGPESTTAPHANLVEFGTAPHDIPLPNGGVWHHPGAIPQPFMRNAFVSKRGAMQSKLGSELQKDILKSLRKLSRRQGATRS